MLVCALALVAGANAQVKQAKEVGQPMNAKVKADAFVTPLVMPQSKGAAKATVEDTLSGEATYHAADAQGSYYLGYGATGLPDEGWSALGHIPAVWFTMGNAWGSYYYGSGEYGYSFDFSDAGWYSGVLQFSGAAKGVTGAIATVGRVNSSVSKVNDKNMPLKFKFYSGAFGQVTQQKGYNDITSNAAGQETLDGLFYPKDPDDYFSYTDIVGVPVIPPREGSESAFGFRQFGARFTRPGLAGEHVCVSVVFPTERNDEDTLWNAVVAYASDGTNVAVTSEKPGGMYAIWDFQYQNMWSNSQTHERLTERVEGFIPDSTAQPNKRYAVVPLQSWNWYDRSGNSTGQIDNEMDIAIILADGVDIERGASYDKYVEVKINPAIDYTVLRAADRIQKVEIFNLNGKLVKTQAYNDNIVEVRLDGLASGMYVAKVTTDGGIASKKIMVR